MLCESQGLHACLCSYRRYVLHHSTHAVTPMETSRNSTVQQQLKINWDSTVERELNAGWTRVERGLNAGWTRIERGLNAGWTRVERGLNAGWTRVERGLNAGWTRVERGLNAVERGLNAGWTRVERGLNASWTRVESQLRFNSWMRAHLHVNFSTDVQPTFNSHICIYLKLNWTSTVERELICMWIDQLNFSWSWVELHWLKVLSFFVWEVLVLFSSILSYKKAYTNIYLLYIRLHTYSLGFFSGIIWLWWCTDSAKFLAQKMIPR